MGRQATDPARRVPDRDMSYSRVLQGIVQGVLTGVGFLGGGVILRSRATIVCAISQRRRPCGSPPRCAVADWRILGVGFALALALLLLGRRVEKWIEHKAHCALLQDGGG